MSLHTRILLPLGAGLLALAGSATAQVQQLRVEPIVVSAAPGESLEFDLRYATDPAQPELTGLGLRLHWDSSQVADASFSPAVGQALLGLSAAEPDALDFDANPETDRFVVIAWADPQAGWPGVDQGILGTMSLTLASGFSGITTLGLSSTSTPAGHDHGPVDRRSGTGTDVREALAVAGRPARHRLRWRGVLRARARQYGTDRNRRHRHQ